MNMGDLLRRLFPVSGKFPVYERPRDLEYLARVQERQQWEIDRLRNEAAAEERARRYRDPGT